MGKRFLVADPSIGALSLLAEDQLVGHRLFVQDAPRSRFVEFLCNCSLAARAARDRTERTWQALLRDGWARTEPPPATRRGLQCVYFTITLRCNLACPYCYVGTRRGSGTDMPLARAEDYLDRIAAENPLCEAVVTGGEPLLHPHFPDVLSGLESRGIDFTILTNGTRIDRSLARRLRQFSRLQYVHVSLDGVTPETHRMTRGDSYAEVRQGISRLIEAEVPFALAPTAHEANLHELPPMAEFAYEHGGYFSPNNLKAFPGNSHPDLVLTDESLYRSLYDVGSYMVSRHGLEALAKIQPPRRTRACPSDDAGPAAQAVCGAGDAIVDVDWNGDVHPCHLLRRPELVLGNLATGSFGEFASAAERLGVRTPASEIPKCSRCPFVALCAGGCRAFAYLASGTFRREDDMCALRHRLLMENLLAQEDAASAGDGPAPLADDGPRR